MVKQAAVLKKLSIASVWLVFSHNVLADTPLGWINAGNVSAYTTTQGELEMSLGHVAVNDTLDFLNYRDDLVKASGRLEGDSGDLSGLRAEISYGITEDLSIFYRRQDHELTLDLSEINSVDLVDIDDSLNTLAESIGLKWTFYYANLLTPNNRHSSASLEVSANRSKSDNFDAILEEIRIDNVTVSFGVPQTFSVNDLEDEGWKARIIYTMPLREAASVSLWAGYGESEATSGTDTDLRSVTLSRFFEQRFETSENYLFLGASLVTNFSPRLALNLNYEYLTVSKSDFTRFPDTPLPELPGFLSPTAQSQVDSNHSLNARLGYWLTPDINLSLTGNLFANQFVGIMPHYNNPLSGSFSDTAYGYAGIELVYNIGNLP